MHDQPLRDDYLVHRGLGLATVRTDHVDGTASYSVLVAVPECRGLYLDTGDTITQADSSFVLNSHGPTPVCPTLDAALRTYAARSGHTTQPIFTAA